MATPLATLVLAETGLAHFWELAETTGTAAADSKGTQTGTYNNGATLNQAGLIASDTNNCPSFVNGSAQFVNLNTTTIVPSGTNAFTWEAWCYPTSSTIGNMRVLGADDGSTNGPSLMFDKPNNQWHFWRSTAAAQLSANAGPISSVYHIVATYDGRVMKLYVNGQSRGGVIDTTSITTIGGAFNIGASGNYGGFWQGKLQYVALYTVALTGAQIRKHYQTGLGTVPAANNAHWYGAYVNTGQSWDASPPANYGELDTWTTWATNNGATTHKPGLFHCFKNYANDAHFPLALAQQANQRGADLMVTWEAWDPGAAGTGGHKADQPAYALQNIVNGNFDSYLSTWANDVKNYGQPVCLRLFHEFNGDYYPWSIVLDGNNNNQSDYVTVNTEALVAAAFRHVRTLFNTVGVTNVKWFWCPNIFLDNYSYHPFTGASYPGDSAVDYVGLDGYNVCANSSTSLWLTFFDLYSQPYDTLAAITSKPVLIPEMACAEDATGFYTKSGWITQAFGTDMPQAFPSIAGFVWEDDVNYPANPSTITINSSPAALSAFQAQIATNLYANQTPFPLPAPTLTSVSPTAVVVNSTFTLTATGSNFQSSSVIQWDGAAFATTYVSSTTLTATVTTSMTAIPATHSITVATPGFATTPAQSVAVGNPTPTLTSLSPSSAVAGGAGFTLTVTGTGFVSGSAVDWNGTALTTTYVSATTLTATVPAGDIAAAGTDSITVVNP